MCVGGEWEEAQLAEDKTDMTEAPSLISYVAEWCSGLSLSKLFEGRGR